MMGSLGLIRKYYGNEMVSLCEDLFDELLRVDSEVLFDVICENFYYNMFLAEDIRNGGEESLDKFKKYIESLVRLKKNDKKSLRELLKSVGYELIECKTYEDISNMKVYYDDYVKGIYTPDQVLNPENYFSVEEMNVFFLVRNNAFEIKHRVGDLDINNEYSKSVVMIWFTKNYNFFNMVGRYGSFPLNATLYGSNLDNIVEGLTKGFEEEYGLNINYYNNSKLNLENYIKANDGKYHKYNLLCNNVYYCPNNIGIINGKAFMLSESFIIADYFYIDLTEKTVGVLDDKIKDSFIDILQSRKIVDIEVLKIDNGRDIKFIFEDGSSSILSIDKCNRIISYVDEYVKEIGDYFLEKCYYLKKLKLPNAEKIGDNLVYNNTELDDIDISNVKYMGDNCLYCNKKIRKIDLSNLIEVGCSLLESNEILDNYDGVLELVNLKVIGKSCFYSNKGFKVVRMDNLEIVSEYIFKLNEEIVEVSFENAREIKDCVLHSAKRLCKLNIGNVFKIGDGCFHYTEDLDTFVAPLVEYIGDDVLCYVKKLIRLDISNVKEIGESFCLKLEDYNGFIYIPNVQCIGDCFFDSNCNVSGVVMPDDTLINEDFWNSSLKRYTLEEYNDLINGLYNSNYRIRKK